MGLIRGLVFFVLFYLYLWLGVEPRLFYHVTNCRWIEYFPVFYKGWPFFQKYFSQPGGLGEYLFAFLAQFFYYSWSGAVVITVQAWLIFLCTDYILRSLKAYKLRWLRFAGPLLLLIVYSQYLFIFIVPMASLSALLLACLYIRNVGKSKPASLVVFLVLVTVLYYFAAGACLLFALICSIYELVDRRRWQLGLTYLLSATAIMYLGGVVIFNRSIIEAYTKLTVLQWPISANRFLNLPVIIYVFFRPLLLAAGGFGLWAIFVRGRGTGLLGMESKIKPLRYAGSPEVREVIMSLAVFVLCGAAIWYLHDGKQKALCEVEYYANQREWEGVLAASAGNPYNSFVTQEVSRALYHTDRLAEEMFSFPQPRSIAPMKAKRYIPGQLFKVDTYLDLGLLNLADHGLTELMVTFKERPPVILQRLAVINMAKGEYGSARIYLGALKQTLFHSDWADNYLKKISDEAAMSADRTIGHLRAVMLQKDSVNEYPPVILMSELLTRNKQNKMAFEYQMGVYLMQKKLDKLAENLVRLNDFDYLQIPRYYEEAILILMFKQKKSIDLHGYEISLESRQRFEDFVKAYRQVANMYGQEKRKAAQQLAKDYGDSYFFYYLFAGK